MESQIKTFSYPNGEIQRVQLVRFDNWSQLEFLRPHPDDTALDCFARIYRHHLVPACPWLFGNLVLFRLPEDLEISFPFASKKYGRLASPLTAAAAALEAGVSFRGKQPQFADSQTEAFWNTLVDRNCLHLAHGKLPVTTIIPVGNHAGFLSQTAPEAALKVNSSFFIMDRFDCATAYDHIGVHIGLCVRNGVVENPPLFRREALLVKKDGSVTVSAPDLDHMVIEVGGVRYHPGENAKIYSRPERLRTPNRHKKQLVIIGCQVAAVHTGSVPIPASGFVLCPEGECCVQPGDRVTYHGMEDVLFGIQVGNSILRDGIKTEAFRSLFYNIRHLQPVPFPPSLYPMNFRKSRAPRIALGADGRGSPMLLWAEGAPKQGYTPGSDSCGASLLEMADICKSLGMYNAVNLDGGGSAQILLNNRRSLKISDRVPETAAEVERPIPIGLIIK